MLKLFPILFIVATAMADSENIRRARSPGGSGWEGSSSFTPQSGGPITRSSGSWNSASGFGRSIGGWENSNRNGGFSGRSGFGSEYVRNSNTWDDYGVDYHSIW